jgi:hypothetical protein
VGNESCLSYNKLDEDATKKIWVHLIHRDILILQVNCIGFLTLVHSGPSSFAPYNAELV